MTTPDSQSLSEGSSRKWLWIGGVAALLLLATLVLALQPGPDDVTAAQPVEVSPDEMSTALDEALDALATAPGFSGVEEARIRGHLSGRIWFSTRSGGDIAVVSQSDQDVVGTAWWLVEDEPPGEGVNVTTNAFVRIEGRQYVATSPASTAGTWQSETGSPIRSVGSALVTDPNVRSAWLGELSQADTTRQGTTDGGTLWTASRPEGTLEATVGPDGNLRTMAMSYAEPPSTEVPVDETSISFTPLSDPPPLPEPTPAGPLDLTAFDLPEDFLIDGS